MKTIKETTSSTSRDRRHYALGRGEEHWALVFEGREAIFKHELGALYVAYLLLNPPKEPLHGVALALDARTLCSQTPGAEEAIQLRSLGLDGAETVRAVRRRERELEAVVDDRRSWQRLAALSLAPPGWHQCKLNVANMAGSAYRVGHS